MNYPSPEVFTDLDVDQALDSATTLSVLRRFFQGAAAQEGSTSVRVTAGDADPFVISAGSTGNVTGLRVYSAARGDEAVTVVWNKKTRRVRALHVGNRIGELRTAGCNAIAAEQIMALIPVWKVAILGAGAQARSHARMLRQVWPCAEIHMWSRTSARALSTERSLREEGVQVTIVHSASSAADSAEVVVTATSADRPVIDLPSLRAAHLLLAIGPKAKSAHELPCSVGDRVDRWTTDSARQLRVYPHQTIFERARAVAEGLPDLNPSRVGSFTLHVSVGVPGSEVPLLEHLSDQGAK